MIHIGNQTSFSVAPTVPFEFALANGFDAFEWFPDKKPGAGWDDTDLSQSQRNQIRESARTHGVSMSVHARWQANPLEPRSLPLFDADIALARELGAVLLNIHLSHERGLPAFVSALEPILERTAQSGLQLSIENTPHHSPELFNDLFSLLAGRNGVGMCLDIGHANLCSATLNDYLGFVDRLGPQVPIIHAHLHENWGDSDSHLTLFTGPSARNDAGIRGVIERLQRRNFSGAFILEQWPQPPSLLVQARERLRRIMGEGAAETAKQPKAKPTQPKIENEDDKKPRDQSLVASTATTFREALVGGDKAARSWREKLGSVKKLLERGEGPLAEADLASLSAYLRFLSTGQIQCEEDGRHFRPGHHSNLALEIGRLLSKRAPANSGFLLRKILPWLPSSAQGFRTAEPLTRIRDIAHRNDIPAELKREIKTTLQNKLHRCAGPEDLVVSEAILQRITAPGASYPPEFVEQFRIFHQELKEFFNARSLDEQLRAVLPECDKGQTAVIETILNRKQNNAVDEQIALFGSVSDLRPSFASRSNRPELLIADVALEDFEFVLLSQILNGLERSPSAGDWNVWLRLLKMSATNLRLGEIEPEECSALESELSAWSDRKEGRDDLLRIKATVERCRRLAEDYSTRVLSLFATEAESLGCAFGVEKNAIRTFCEADIRAHLIFQVSKLCSSLLQRLRTKLRLPPWDVLVTGEASGILQSAHQLNGADDGVKTPAILILEQSSGDEEIPEGVTGILLQHSLPHLSHLAVRARQAGTVFVCAEDPSALGTLKRLEGKLVALKATPETVMCTGEKRETEWARARTQERRPLPDAKLESAVTIIALGQRVDSERAGAKAASAAQLSELSGAEFKTPPGVVLPFGAMEEAVAAKPPLNEQYQQLLLKAAKASLTELVTVAESLRVLIQQVEVPERILSGIAGHFGAEKRLIVRSSSNAEDLPELAGAGLYESVLDVRSREASEAIKTVWASLWSRRAALSRQQTGVAHEQVHMAVLIQEMLAADFSFVLHTVNPLNQNREEIYEEIAVGLGETLVSGAERGNAYRVVCNVRADETTVTAYANFSTALLVDEKNGVSRKTVDYSHVRLSTDSTELKGLGRRLAAAARFVEDAFKTPLDIEGAIVGNDVYLVQARPQQGMAVSTK